MSKLKKTAMNLASECNLVTSNDYLIAAYTYDANKSIISKTPTSANIIAVNSQKLYISGYWTSSGLSWKEFNSNNGLEILTSTPSQTSKVISGTIKNSSGVGISGATVKILDSSNNILATVTTTTGGIFNANLSSAANPSKLTVSASGYTTQTVSISSLVGNSITLQPSSITVSGTVKNSSGVGISGATVQILNSSNGTLATVTTTSSGTFNASLAAGTSPAKLTVSASGYTTQTVSISNSNLTNITVTLQPSSITVSGTVKNSSGVGISGATVQILNSSNGVLKTVNTTTGGVFSTSLEAGASPAKLTVSASGYTTQTVSISSTNLTNITVTLQAMQVTYILSGQVFDTNAQQPISGVTVSVSGISAVTDDDGNFYISTSTDITYDQLYVGSYGYIELGEYDWSYDGSTVEVDLGTINISGGSIGSPKEKSRSL